MLAKNFPSRKLRLYFMSALYHFNNNSVIDHVPLCDVTSRVALAFFERVPNILASASLITLEYNYLDMSVLVLAHQSM